MIPLSGFLSRALGTRILFSISAAGFTAASLMCGLSTSINEMIVWRRIQGFIGGAMIPTVFATSFMIFPRSRMGLITPLIGLVATLEPIVDLGALADRSFGLGSLFSFVLGIGLYGLTYLYPVYLAQIHGYSALMIGETMFISGVAMFATAPIAGRLMTRIDPQVMLLT